MSQDLMRAAEIKDLVRDAYVTCHRPAASAQPVQR